ncbi:late competence development ComFB family protein [Cellulosilyticum sp. I15G10I2]|uniref:late competence development ComFB family protein n=1 Tax=Cellulosilyticum sp. I15G10I2 TaxID=1892843 RepID=UPI001A9A6CF9|nr:late competence development ComFB family protein [Cellulosilyticum sp. I15G10I2]
MEILVEKYLESVMEEWDDLCTCEKCKRDIMALALNNLKPMYIATDAGSVYVKANTTFNPQYATDVVLAINAAIKIVHNEVRHE